MDPDLGQITCGVVEATYLGQKLFFILNPDTGVEIAKKNGFSVSRFKDVL